MSEAEFTIDYKFLLNVAISYQLVGSRVTCNPAPKGTDQDVLVYISPQDWERFNNLMVENGASHDGDDRYADPDQNNQSLQFKSFSVGDSNFIVTSCLDFHNRFLAASSVAKKLNLLDKQDRIMLFQAVIYGTRHSDIVIHQYQPEKPLEPLVNPGS